MRKEIEDWIDFCNGSDSFDIDDFHTLFMYDDIKEINEEELSAIFKPFPKAEELYKRLISYFSETDFRTTISNLEAYILKAVKKDIREKSNAVDDEDILSSLATEPVIIKDQEIIDESVTGEFNREYIILVGDYVDDSLYSEESKVYALLEALYGLTSNYHLVWYLASPLIDTDINFDNYYDIWKVGGDYAVSEEGVIVFK